MSFQCFKHRKKHNKKIDMKNPILSEIIVLIHLVDAENTIFLDIHPSHGDNLQRRSTCSTQPLDFHHLTELLRVGSTLCVCVLNSDLNMIITHFGHVEDLDLVEDILLEIEFD